jgi:hypothetical protein
MTVAVVVMAIKNWLKAGVSILTSGRAVTSVPQPIRDVGHSIGQTIRGDERAGSVVPLAEILAA